MCDPGNANAVRTTYNGKSYTGWVARDSCYTVTGASTTATTPTQAPAATSAPAQASSTGDTAIPTSTPIPTAVGIAGVATSMTTLTQGKTFTITWNDATKNDQYRLYLLVKTNTSVSNRFFAIRPEYTYVRQSNRYFYQYALTQGEVDTFYNAVLAEKNKPNSQITGLKIAIRRTDKSSAIDFDNEPGVPIALIDQQVTVASATTPTPVVTTAQPTAIQTAINRTLGVNLSPGYLNRNTGGNLVIRLISNFTPNGYVIHIKLRRINGNLQTLKTISLNTNDLAKILQSRTIDKWIYDYEIKSSANIANELVNLANKYEQNRVTYPFIIQVAVPENNGQITQSSLSVIAKEILWIADYKPTQTQTPSPIKTTTAVATPTPARVTATPVPSDVSSDYLINLTSDNVAINYGDSFRLTCSANNFRYNYAYDITFRDHNYKVEDTTNGTFIIPHQKNDVFSKINCTKSFGNTNYTSSSEANKWLRDKINKVKQIVIQYQLKIFEYKAHPL